MTAVIKSFPGVPDITRPSGAQPQPRVIAFLQDLLDRAQRGDIQAVAATFVMPDQTVADGWRLGPNTTHQIVAGVTYLQNRVASLANANDQAEAPPPPQGA